MRTAVRTFRYEKIPDWAHLRKRYKAFWNKQVLDSRPIVQIQNPNPSLPDPASWMLQPAELDYTQADRFFELKEWWKAQWNWHADLFQYMTLSAFGPLSFLAFCAAQPIFTPDTVWYEPVINSLDEADTVHFDQDSRYWRTFLELLEGFVEKCAGKQQIAIPVDGGPLDWIASTMGIEKLLLATLEQPEKVHKFAIRLANEYMEAYDIFCPILTARNDGVCNWMPVWSDRPFMSVQDDLAINISPQMYQDIFLPALRRIAGYTGRSVLHWHDGARQHVDWIAGSEEFDVVQWGHDPASPPFRSALPDMRKIQEAGKLLFISCVEACDVKFFIDNLDPRGLAMIVNTTSDEESKKLEDYIAQWTTERFNLVSLQRRFS
ncbi:MAG: hypothetical protein GWP14_08980 [Actinobacteria bacterium]|nr:hypothetical protein [Actinomycetota bacterium]